MIKLINIYFKFKFYKRNKYSNLELHFENYNFLLILLTIKINFVEILIIQQKTGILMTFAKFENMFCGPYSCQNLRNIPAANDLNACPYNAEEK